MIQHVDWFLFQILILGGLMDKFGNVWRRSSKQICVVECTVSKMADQLQLVEYYLVFNILDFPVPFVFVQEYISSVSNILSLLSVFPHTTCISPNEVQRYYNHAKKPSKLMNP